MPLSEKKNRGEWSELYALINILAHGEIDFISANDDAKSPTFPVVLVTQEINGVSHDFRIEDLVIEILNTSSQLVQSTIPRAELHQKADLILYKIKAEKGRTFAIPEANEIMSILGLERVTGGGGKVDLTLTIYDPRIGQEIQQGFSIKSFIGSKPTLLNASGVTNIEYAIQGGLTSSETKRLNKLWPIDLVTQLVKENFKLLPSKMNYQFAENLKMIDSEMDALVAQVVLASFRGEGRTMHDIVNILTKTNPLKYLPPNVETRYTHKIKDLLEAVALGMRPSQPWTGGTEARGGNLVVTSSGQLICHHALDKDSLRNYLFDNTAIDTPSRKRHKFGSIINNTLTLNFQIRFR